MLIDLDTHVGLIEPPPCYCGIHNTLSTLMKGQAHISCYTKMASARC